ncbi:MAG: LysM peptidoglycan-binding domain-containing M23 family metallopeptidase [Rhizobiales bacterium]|nr:LysM peptidoglycan-binding domain-containing M23 family metallopeptidase [Hyphomicrobiales bacterium]
MRTSFMRCRGALLARFATVTAIGVSAAACSMDVTRFDSNPFNNRQDTTASIPQQRPQTQAQVPGHQLPQRNYVETQPLNNPQQPPASNYRPNTVPAAPSPMAKNRQLNAPRTTAAVNANDWAWDGGRAVTVQQGETVYSISRKHNVPAEVILRANNLQSASAIQPGQRLVIPVRRTADVPMIQNRPVANAPMSTHTAVSGDTIYSLSRKYKTTPQAIANANNLTLSTQLKIGQQVRIPAGAAPIVNTPAAQPQTLQRNVKSVPQTPPQQIVQSENVPAPESVGVVRPNTPPAVSDAPRAQNAAPTFHWPVRGRILSAYGRKPNGQQNDGINVSVPDGTPIRASEDGVVAYAGNELKGFGNLVLIRHADNWVTAYAHLGTIDVKKDQKVKRGDTIARAGQTGGVTSPQLHFEIRKGSNPVDPEKHLSGI